MKFENKINKICCFYADEWHLTVMLLPFLDKNLDKNSSFYMKFENKIQDKMELLVNKLELKNKMEILKLDWSGQNVNELDDDGLEKTFIVSGEDEYIKKVNKQIEEYYSSKKCNVRVINCYDIYNNENAPDVIEKYGYKEVLNTSGISSIK